MTSYYGMPGVDTGVPSSANSSDARGNLHLRLAVGGEAGFLVEEQDQAGDVFRSVAIYFPAERVGDLIAHLRALQAEHLAQAGADHSEGSGG